MEVQLGKKQDVDEWMKLVEEISWNFPGLETREALNEYRETVLRFIGKNQALCVRNDAEVVGVLLFSRGRIHRGIRKEVISLLDMLLKKHSDELSYPPQVLHTL